MTDKVLLSASRNNVEECAEVAKQHGLGLEFMAFAFPDVLDGDWRELVAHYQTLTADINGAITLHGPFFDMVSGSLDPKINAVCTERYKHAIDIAAMLNARQMVLHANFIGLLHNRVYRSGWHERSVAFWRPILDYAAEKNVLVLIENMWEYDPTILSDLLEALDHPAAAACLDVGHAHLFSAREFTFDYWLRTLKPWVREVHMNNNNGIIDEHHGLDWEHGALDYATILPRLRSLGDDVDFVLEMDTVADMVDSLKFFNLASS